MQPLDIVSRAIRQAPCDAERLLCWFINTRPPAKRQSFYEQICAAIGTARLTGLLASPLSVPSLFTADAAERTWDDLTKHLGPISDNIEKLAPFFRPDDLRFVPHAYPGRWAPVTWNRPLTPVEVREALGINDSYCNELARILQDVAEAERSRSQVEIFLPRDQFTSLRNKQIRVAVLPYADTMPMVTMLYAVSDKVDCLGFGPASFYKQDRRTGPAGVWIEEGIFNAGYATNYQMKELTRKNPSLSTKQVFREGFIRSLLMQGDFVNRKKVPTFGHLSFVGQLGAEVACDLDPHFSDPMALGRGRYQFDSELTLSEYLNPIVNWELPLALAFAGRVDGHKHGQWEWDGLALTISTDAHLWAASFAFNLRSNAVTSTMSSAEPTFRRGAWNPLKQSGASDEDRQSELCWFVPVLESSSELVSRLNSMVDRFIVHKVHDLLEDLRSDMDPFALSTTRDKLSPIARSLIAPLLSNFPAYRGPMLSAPPEAWMRKLLGPATYIEYSPHWHERLILAPTNEANSVEQDPFTDCLKFA